jgi:hypothetical protein
VKVYLYSSETGVYQGEDFTDTVPITEGRGGAVPPHATIIAPPPFGAGEVPVFLPSEGRWEVRSRMRLKD